MKNETVQSKTEESLPGLPVKTNPIFLPDFDPTSPTGKKPLPPNWFKHKIFNSDGFDVGFFVGAICKTLDEIHAAVGSIREQYLNHINGGLRFPCAALREIKIKEIYWSSGSGSQGLRHFEEIAIAHQCEIAITRRGWTPGMADGRSKILNFYTKNGWTRLDIDNSTDLVEPWSFKILYSTC